MRKKLGLVAIMVASAFAIGGTAASAAVEAPVAVAKVCSTSYGGYVTAQLQWGVKCLHAGEFCKIGNPAYLRYGFVCPATGHLRRR